jgi:tetratricopeptide (TPR) repeat protein
MYEQAIQHDPNLGLAYNNLGRLHILQDQPESAVWVLQAGLKRATGTTETDLVTRYQLLSSLGRAYYMLKRYELAQSTLQEAVALEANLPTDSSARSAVPHYFLGLTYRALDKPNDALIQFEDSLRYLDHSDPQQSEWEQPIRDQLEELRKKSP